MAGKKKSGKKKSGKKTSKKGGKAAGRKGAGVRSASRFAGGFPEDLLALLEVPAVSGGEEAASQRFAELCRQAGADSVEIDAVGNVIARRGTPDRGVMAHLDTVGWMVQKVEERRARLVGVGGVSPCTMNRAELVTEEGRAIRGLVMTEPGGKRPAFEPLNPRDLARIRVGDRVSYARTYEMEGTRMQGPYLDNRLGCFALLEALRSEQDLLAVATVCEETTTQGAYHVRRQLEDLHEVLVVDVTYGDAYDIDYPIEVGEGPVVGMMDSLMPPRPAIARVEAAARAAGVELQREVCPVGGTDGTALAQWDRPVLWCFFGVPSRYNHQPVEVVDLRDVDGWLKVIHAWLALPPLPDPTSPQTGSRSRRRKR